MAVLTQNCYSAKFSFYTIVYCIDLCVCVCVCLQVDVTVHLGADNDHETRKEIAAALAESARKLAQSAADFDQEDSYSQHYSRRSSSQLSHRSSLQSRRQLFPTQSSSVSLTHDHTHAPLPTVSLDRPRTTEQQRSHNTLPTRTEVSRRHSLTRAPPPESPLRISQRSLNSDFNPGTYVCRYSTHTHLRVLLIKI